jgi:hypothetical protein
MDASNVMKLDVYGYSPIYYAANFNPDFLPYFRKKLNVQATSTVQGEWRREIRHGARLFDKFYHDEGLGSQAREKRQQELEQASREQQRILQYQRAQKKQQDEQMERWRNSQQGESSVRGFSTRDYQSSGAC